ncbi:MAG: quinate 5-dehydrogenase [Armatimonadota bacterium]|nr:quinate 5-dehydrogenase [Armatimonadota bacterium]MDR5702106.1 quinate 5-dehydrogenase [Armatimonadota bacterium]MDR7434164.1 quinate 5-dehydrogenase [Armatimonadota bacterium]
MEEKPLKRIVSVSLGSPKRDKRVEIEILGERFQIERIGTGGDLEKARQLFASLDGKVTVLCVGGTDLWLRAGKRRYPIRDAFRMVRDVRQTPLVDGGGIKTSWERHLILDYLPRVHGISFRGKRVLLVSSVDRYGMAEAFVEAGADVIFGDFIFALGLPIPLRTLRSVQILAALLLPILTRLPFRILYPTGERQEIITPKHHRYYQWAEVIAGDFHLIRRYMPEDLRGKVIFTNTVTSEDVEELRRRGVHLLITSAPEIDGRSFGTNIIEGIVVALSGKGPEELTPGDYLEWLGRIGFAPRVEALNPV